MEAYVSKLGAIGIPVFATILWYDQPIAAQGAPVPPVGLNCTRGARGH